MSKFVNELLNSIYNKKNNWKKCSNGTGIEMDNIIIEQFGNSRLLSIICVEIDNQNIPLTYMDKYRLEKAVGWWYQNVDLNQLLLKNSIDD